MINKKSFLLFTTVCLFSNMLIAQQKKQHEVQLLTDNDAYLLQIKDGYYSSGIYLKYATIFYNQKQQKIIKQWRLNHQIYTPQSRRYYALQGIDRPFAGYLSVGYTHQQFTNNHSSLEIGAEIGTIGSNALAKPVQDFIHNLMQFRPYNGWENEVSNEVTMNTHVKYTTTLFKEKNNRLLAIHPFVHINIGTAFTNASGGAYFCIGKLEQLFTSGLLYGYAETNTTQKKHTNELIFFCKPHFMYQAFNATIQGGLFTQQQTGVTRTLNAYLFQQTWGFMYNTKQIGLHVGVTYQSRETAEQDKPQRFGTIGIAYRW